MNFSKRVFLIQITFWFVQIILQLLFLIIGLNHSGITVLLVGHTIMAAVYLIYYFILMPKHWNKTNEEIRRIEEEKFKNEAKQIINKETTSFLHRNIPELIRLADQKPDLLKKAIISFSELLRYSLYQKNAVPLNQELEMLKDYEKLCNLLSGSFSLTIRTNGNTKNVTVIPTHLIYKLQECINKTSDKPEGKYIMEIFSDSSEIKSVTISKVFEKTTENIIIQ